jgi:hypothetical protein
MFHLVRPSCRRLLAAFVTLLLFSPVSPAGHLRGDTYPYAVEVSLDLVAQEKFYLVDPGNTRLFRESTATRLAGYKFWGSGIVASQNDPDDDAGPHGPLRNIGLLVHEMGENREGESTIELIEDGEGWRLRLVQHTVLVHRSGDKVPDVDIDVDMPLELGVKDGKSVNDSTRISARLTQAGAQQFEAALVAMVRNALASRRGEIDDSLAANGLRIIPGTEHFAVNMLRHARMRMVFDNELGAARLRLPDMRLVMGARLEQMYADSASDRD